MALVILLLEASRRVIGPALPVIAGAFIIYAFAGPYMPDLIAFKGVSLNRFVGQMTMSTEGIYGIPLDVSATIVFLFVLFGSMLDKAGAGQYFIRWPSACWADSRAGRPRPPSWAADSPAWFPARASPTSSPPAPSPSR
jgi:TRAP-type uncharacterized transport system fused permease subunit